MTGHTGFKGAWLSFFLVKLGAKVTGVSLPPAGQENLYNKLKLSELIDHSYYQDIRDEKKIEQLLINSKPEIIFHMAAQSLVMESYSDPLNTYDVNVIGTLKLLLACRKLDNLKVVIVVTSDKCYENQEWEWPYRENDKLGGFDPYSNSKACCELVVDSFRNSFLGDGSENNFSIATARAGNVIGGGDYSDNRIVPDFYRAYKSKKPITLRMPDAIRPWQHVLEPLYGYLMLAYKNYFDSNKYSGAWNFGPDDSDFLTVKQLIDGINDFLDHKVKIKTQSSKFHEAKILKLDNTKAKIHLNWKPRLNSTDVVRLICDFFNSENINLTVDNQIDYYLSKVKEQ